jgi:heptose I phosphotransferase
MTKLFLSAPFKGLWQNKDPFQEADRLEGEVFRQMRSRRTIRFTVNGRAYFAKIHHGIGWCEIAKNLLQLKRPVLGAENEWTALNLLRELGLDTMTPVAFGLKGHDPARRCSFIITEELAGTESLEDFCANWPSEPPPFRLRKALIERVASMVREMHRHGMNHRDCYICHFHLGTSTGQAPLDTRNLRLHVIDLHRAQVRSRTPRRWVIKDLGGLYFSAMDIGLTRTDRLRFARTYEQKSLREVLPNGRFWRRVEKTAKALYMKHFGASPPARS